jgi:tetratricopeptide (TPR) repeat protein
MQACSRQTLIEVRMLSQSIKVLVLCVSVVCATCACEIQKGFEIGTKTGEGNGLLTKGKYPEAEQKYNEALQLIERDVERKDVTEKLAAVLKAHVLAKLGVLYTREKDYAQAESKFKESLKLFGQAPDLSVIARAHMKECLLAYAELLKAEGKADQATEMSNRASKN